MNEDFGNSRSIIGIGEGEPIKSTLAPRIGLLFLVRGNLHQPDLWERYIQESQGAVSVYCHAKNPEEIQSGPLVGRIISEHHDTWWGHLSLVIAMLALLRAAMKDATLTHFVFLSESCVPIRSANALSDLLRADGRSRFSFMSIHEAYSLAPDKPRRFAHADSIPHDHRYFQPQWVLLDREAALLLLANDQIAAFEGVVAADECYFGTVLSMAGLDLNCGVVNENVTWCRWQPGAWHPDVHNDITAELQMEWKASGCFFARKISSNSIWQQSV